MKSAKRLDWINILFLTLTPIIAITGVSWVIWRGDLHWATLVLTIILAMASGISITAGYHRLFSHRSYDARWPVRFFFLIFGGASFQNSAREWCFKHRNHHRFVDAEKDPYDINKGFFYAHMGWIFFHDDDEEMREKFKNIRGLL